MPEHISRYLHIITQEADLLMANPIDKLSPVQSSIMGSIQQYTRRLSAMNAAIGETCYTEEVRHKLLDLLTPISGYVEMFVEGWIGDLNTEQRDHIKLIFTAVHRLTDHIRSEPVDTGHVTLG